MQSIVLFLSLVVLWLLWSGLYLPLMLFLGLASCLLVVWLVKRFQTVDHESVPLHLGFGIFGYWGWLLKEITISSLQVTRIILAPKLQISPTMVSVQCKSSGQVRQVLFANSITLTPGTLTTDIDENGLVSVHALTREGAQGVVSGDMNDRVARLPGIGDK
jgi:multicomponent Na+:H+ antiporter subunit E